MAGARLLSLLPEIFGDARDPDAPTLLARLLALLEEPFHDIEVTLDRISDRFSPAEAPADYLPWLASWTALVLRTDWTVAQQREVLGRIIPLYRKRGTKAGLEEYLRIYVDRGVSIGGALPPFQVGTTSTVGGEATVGGAPPYFFTVHVTFDTLDPVARNAKAEAVRAVLDVEKPAYTYYRLTSSGPTFQVGVLDRSTVGVSTVI